LLLSIIEARIGAAAALRRCPNPQFTILLSLTLFMLRISADHAHDALAVNDLAVIAHLFN
jgi:hypothetical protein